MLFVALSKVKGGTNKERTARRIEWKYPEGMHLVAEYWLQTENPSVITVAEADSIVPIMAAIAAWDDLFEITVFPAITAEEGLEFAKQMMQK